MTRAVVCVATTPYYQRGMVRLVDEITRRSRGECIYTFAGLEQWPSHKEKPYAFKAYAMKHAVDHGADLLLWADACMLPVADMTPLWERIERDGYWMSRNGYSNYEWTADSAYPDLFPEVGKNPDALAWHATRVMNQEIPHVVATCFGLNVRHPKGRAFLDEYYRLASETRAFCGPWINAAYPGPVHASMRYDNPRIGVCGPAGVRGHRHDQTAASVIAWRLGFELTDPPEVFAYGKSGEAHDPRTIMIADGSYE